MKGKIIMTKVIPGYIKVALLVASGALVLSGCSSAAETVNTAAPTEAVAPVTAADGLPENCSAETPKIGVALPNLSNPYYVEMKKGVETAAAEHGFEVIVSIANDDIVTQLSQIDSFIQAEVCAVYLNAIGSEPGTGFAVSLSKAGIPVFAVNVFIDMAAVEAAGGSVVQNLGADQAGGGTLSGEQALMNLGADAKIVAGIVGVPSNVTTNLRDAAFTAALEKNPNAKVVQTVDHEVKPDVAQKVTAEMLLGNPDMNVIFADTGPGVVGALLAIKQLKLEDKVQLYGFCADKTKIEKPYMGCVGQAPDLYGQLAIAEIKKYISGTQVEKEILVPTPIFNVGEVVPSNIIG